MMAQSRDSMSATGHSHASMQQPAGTESGVSWSAIIAGGVGAAALALVLVLLSIALGFAVTSPWAGAGASATAIGIGGILWLSFTHVASSGLGGYLAGRLRTRWTGFRSDEVYFRDTVHGFLTWSLATLVTAGLIAAAVGAVLDRDETGPAAMEGAGAAALAAANGEEDAGILRPWAIDYYVDTLFRANGAQAEPADSQTRERVARVLRFGLVFDELRDEDRQYVAQLVAQHTGLGVDQAQQRADAVFEAVATARNEVREALDEAREAAAWTTGWMFIALLLGAFVASLAATYGGRHRDTQAEVTTP